MGNTATAGSTAAENAGTTLMRNFETELNRGPSIYNRSLYAGAPGTMGAASAGAPALRQAQDFNSSVISRGGFNGTQRGAMDWNRGLLDRGGFNGVQRSAIGTMDDVLAETEREAPGAALVRQGLADSTLNGVGDIFSASGRFGGGGHVRTATDQLASNLGEFDLNQYNTAQDRRSNVASSLFGAGQTGNANAQNAANSLFAQGQQGIANAGAAAAAAPGLFEAGLRPGQIADTDAQARLMADYDLWDRTENANTNRLAQFMGMLQGANGMQGTEEEVPWWQTALGYVAGNAGNALRTMGGQQ